MNLMRAAEGGVAGEAAAREFLQEKGFRFRCARYRGCGGEIDLVMEDGDTLVFVEVKNRPGGSMGEGFAAVGRNKQLRMARAASLFLAKEGDGDRGCRFDVVEITRQGIAHIENAFMADMS